MKRQLYFIDIIAYVAMYVALWAYTPHGLRFKIGMSMAAAAFILWITARVQLGASFTARAEAKKLVTTGLYSKIRNPIYFFAQVAYLGLAIAWGTIAGYVIFASMIPFQALRARKERGTLEAAFGEEYRAYVRQTWF